MAAILTRSSRTTRPDPRVPNPALIPKPAAPAAQDSGGSWATSGSANHAFGPAGLQFVPATARTLDQRNRLITVGAHTLTYDSDGNTTTDETGGQMTDGPWGDLARYDQ